VGVWEGGEGGGRDESGRHAVRELPHILNTLVPFFCYIYEMCLRFRGVQYDHE
jgi:hypothetical protein